MQGTAAIGCSMLLAVAFGCSRQESTDMESAVDETAEAVQAEIAEPQPVAVAVLHDASGMEVGRVTFTEIEDIEPGVKVHAEVSGITPAGKHGIHVHEIGECMPPDFGTAGGHFNPSGAPHACPPTSERHSGDLGNIEVDAEGNGTLDLTDSILTIDGSDLSVVGRAVILHGGEDDCTTQPSGDSGPRIACGVISLLGDEDEPAPEGEMATE
jgi:Cu-Zn family superoxide dismutase